MIPLPPNTLPAFLAGEVVPVEVRMEPQPPLGLLYAMPHGGQGRWRFRNAHNDGFIFVRHPLQPGTRYGVGDHHCEVVTAEPPVLREGVWYWRATVKKVEHKESPHA